MSRSNQIFSLGYVTLFLFPVLAKADHFVATSFPVRLPLPPLLFLLAILIPVLFKYSTKNEGESLSRTYQKMMLIALPFLLITVVSAVWSLHPGANWKRGYRFLVMDLYTWFLFMVSIGLAHSRTIQKYNHLIFLFILSGACGAIWVDLVYPGTFSGLETRAAGFAGNSNWGGRIIIFLAIASIQWEKNNLRNLLILVISGLAVFATLSVGCLVLYLMVLIGYLVLKLRQQKSEHFVMKLALIPTVLVLILFVIQPVMLNMMEDSKAFSNKNSQDRIDQILNMTRGDFTFATDHSRSHLVDEYWELISAEPLVGYGTGSSLSRSKRPHNIYIKHWMENGLLGIVILVVFIICAFIHFRILRDTRGMMLVFIFFMSGFFDHNLLQYKTFVVLLGILGALAYLERSNGPVLAKPRQGIIV